MLAILAACGYVGDPRPPALNIPSTIDDLRAVQRGPRILFEFTIPERTTEGMLVDAVAEVRLHAGDRAVPVDARRPGPAHAELPVAGLAGETLAFTVEVRHRRGRWSDPSNTVTLRVVPPVEPPAGLAAEDAPTGVRLHWQSPAAAFRVFRIGEQGPQEAARVTAREWVDTDAVIGRRHDYSVQALGEAGAESEPSAVISIVPEDRFPPAVPSGLTAIGGLNTIELAWETPADPDLAGFHVYRAPPGGEFVRLTAEPAPAPSYSDREVKPGATYRYAVSAVDQRGNESARGGDVTATAPML